MYAVIGIGGKQVRVAPGETVRIETLPFEAGMSVAFEHVLMVGGGEQGTIVGTPTVPGAKVLAKVVGHGRAKKVLIFKKKRRKQYRRTNGHRQNFTAVKIEQIETADVPAGQTERAATEPVESRPFETSQDDTE